MCRGCHQREPYNNARRAFGYYADRDDIQDLIDDTNMHTFNEDSPSEPSEDEVVRATKRPRYDRRNFGDSDSSSDDYESFSTQSESSDEDEEVPDV